MQREKVPAGWRAEVKELDTTKSLPKADSGSEAVLYIIDVLIPLIYLTANITALSSRSTLETAELVVVVEVVLEMGGEEAAGGTRS